MAQNNEPKHNTKGQRQADVAGQNHFESPDRQGDGPGVHQCNIKPGVQWFFVTLVSDWCTQPIGGNNRKWALSI